VQVGHEGVTEALARAAGEQLKAHELIKVRISDEHDRHETAQLLAQKCNAEVAQVLGRTALLYRRRQEKPEIELPGAGT